MPKYIFRNGQIYVDENTYVPVTRSQKTDLYFSKSAVVMVFLVHAIADLSDQNPQENKFHEVPRYK